MGWSDEAVERRAVRERWRLRPESRDQILGKLQRKFAQAEDDRTVAMHGKLILGYDVQQDRLEQEERRLDLQERALERRAAADQQGHYDATEAVAQSRLAAAEYDDPATPGEAPGA